MTTNLAKDPTFKRLSTKDLDRMLLEYDGKLPISEGLYIPLLVQTGAGHAQSGHRTFWEERKEYPNASISDFIEAAGLDVDAVKSIRQGLIDDCFEALELFKQDKSNSLVVNGRPLLGVEFFRDIKVVPEYFLKGFIMCGLMDSSEWRKKTLKKYGHRKIDGSRLELGHGETHLIDSKYGENLYCLANREHTDKDIANFYRSGMLVKEGHPNAEVVYVRKKRGTGISDDTAFIMTGLTFKPIGWKEALSAFLGGVVVDGMDTYDKCVSRPAIGGYDEKAAKETRASLSPDFVTDNQIMDVIFYAAKTNGKRVVSSSHKRLIQPEGYGSPIQPTVLHHLDFLRSGRTADFEVGYERMNSIKFYQRVKFRMEHYQKTH